MSIVIISFVSVCETLLMFLTGYKFFWVFFCKYASGKQGVALHSESSYIRAYTAIYIYIKYIIYTKKRRDRLCGPPNLLFNGYRGHFPGVSRDVNHARSSSAEVKNELSYAFAAPICVHGVDRKCLTYTYVRACIRSYIHAYEYTHIYIRTYKYVFCVLIYMVLFFALFGICYCCATRCYVIELPCIHTHTEEDRRFQVSSFEL